jgi:hypothetical protein
VNPAVVVWDAAAALVVVLVKLGRQDDRFGWWRGFGASHANRVAALSSVTAGVLDSPFYEQPPGEVEERQAASLGLGPQHGDDLVDPLGLAALVASPGVHLLLFCSALARWGWLNADAL